MLPHTAQPDDIAIIGMSCRVAGAESPSELWENLVSSKDVQSRIKRFNIDGFYHPKGGKRKGLTNVQHAYFMDQELDKFDNAFFSIPPLEALAMDPQHRLLLELTYEATESAGIPLEKFQGSRTAVYTGIFGNDYGSMLSRDPDATPKYNSTGTSNSIAANRISYAFDLHGPSLAIDTACSSTIVALHQACSALRQGDAEMAVVSGSNLILNMDMFVHMSELGFLSPTGRCRSFDASGDGYVRAEGVLAILVKTVKQATADGDPIRAVIKGTRINQDGRTQGITLPSSDAQRENLGSLYESHGFDPADTQYMEAHGTGTAAGDPIELSAIDAVFGPGHVKDKLIVGSVKSNIGHLESCAALAGMIKTVLALEHGQIPPQMHFHNPNPKIDFSHIYVPSELMEWPSAPGATRRAGINSFGFGGTNGTAVLDYYPAEKEQLSNGDRPLLFKLSANTKESLRQIRDKYADYVEKSQPNLVDFAHTLLARRSNLQEMLFITAATHEELATKLRLEEPTPKTRSNNEYAKLGGIFTGQGAQWVQMGKELIDRSPLFRYIMEVCDNELKALHDGPSWSIIEELSKPKEESRVYTSSFSQPLCTALQLGLVNVLRSWGIELDFVMGHSSGEVAAAYTAGFLTMRDAIVVAYYRGLFLSGGKREDGMVGKMCAVGLGEDKCNDILKNYKGRVALAASNSPSSSTLSGDGDAIDEIVEYAKTEGIFCRPLRVDTAFHSHWMLPSSKRYQKALEDSGVTFQKPAAGNPDMFSSVTGRKLTPEECTPEYWMTNMVSTVRFTAAVKAAAAANEGVEYALLEVGPHPALSGPVGDTLADVGKTGVPTFGTCSRGKPDLQSLLLSAGAMITAGINFSVDKINAIDSLNGDEVVQKQGNILTDIPHYVWDHSLSHWAESRLSASYRMRVHRRHELLGARMPGDSPLHPTWRNLLMLGEVEWLAKMKEAGQLSVPHSVYLLMAFEACRQLSVDAEALKLKNVKFHSEIPFSVFKTDSDTFETHFHMELDQKTAEYTFTVTGGVPSAPEEWKRLCSGKAQLQSSKRDASHKTVAHDAKLAEYLDEWFGEMTCETPDVSICRHGASGVISDEFENNEHYLVDPSGLAYALKLPGRILSADGVPANYVQNRITAVELSFTQQSGPVTDFSFSVERTGYLAGAADGFFSNGKGSALFIEGSVWSCNDLLRTAPPLRSLFYKPVYAADITHKVNSESSISVNELLQLVTHKWPAADIGVSSESRALIETLSSALRLDETSLRARFRSLTVAGQDEISRNRISFSEDFDQKYRSHLMFASTTELEDLKEKLAPYGLVCAKVDSSEDKEAFEANFSIICSVDLGNAEKWALGRAKTTPSEEASVQVFVPENVGDAATYLESFAEADVVMLDKSSVSSAKVKDSGVMLDCGKESILTSWAGETLIPSLQSILDTIKTLVWVTRQRTDELTAFTAGSFLRTIKAENPKLKVVHLHLHQVSDNNVSSIVHSVYERLMEGESELELVAIGKTGINILRYQPDDELSAAVGIAPPRPSSLHGGLSGYRIETTSPSAASVLFERIDTHETVKADQIEVKTKLSLVDAFDAQVFVGATPGITLGHFFTGSVFSSQDDELKEGQDVVGWTSSGAHKAYVVANVKHCLPLPSGVSAEEALERFAAICTAAAIINLARPTAHDLFTGTTDAILDDALDIAFAFFGTMRVDGETVDFTVSKNASGTSLNGETVQTHKFMESARSDRILAPLFSNATFFVTSLEKQDDFSDAKHQSAFELAKRNRSFSKTSTDKYTPHAFSLAHSQQAFEQAEMQNAQTIIRHDDDLTGVDALVTAKIDQPSHLFDSNGAYVIIGLGGLAEYLATWMAKNGARKIFAITRSGPDSPFASKACDAVAKHGAEMQVIAGDACDPNSTVSAFETIRSQAPISGIYNMVMVLQDTSFSSMTASKWDKSLGVKVKSVQNLHRATLEDKLDFFIMFSSVSSIFGNRTQSNYAAGNAYQNAFAAYRRSIGLPAVAVALGAVKGIGVLAENEDLQRSLISNGLRLVDPLDFEKIMEAAILESLTGERSLIVTGFEMFKTLNGKVQAPAGMDQAFWTEMPEFGFLLEHNQGDGAANDLSIREQLEGVSSEEAHALILDAFLGCVSNVLGYDKKALNPASALTNYGLDSLNAVSCRYWFFKELDVDVPVFDVIGCKSINILIDRVVSKLETGASGASAVSVPEPTKSTDLAVRPVSHSQKRLWFLHRFIADKTVYNLLLTYHLEGKVDEKLLQKTWTLFIRRHEVLHSKLVDTEDGLQQIPVPDYEFNLENIECDDTSFPDMEKAITTKSRSHVFDIENGELVRGYLLRSPKNQRFFLASHHLAWDRSSVPTIFNDTIEIYRALQSGKTVEDVLPEVPFQFIDYTVWQNKVLDTPGLVKPHTDHWAAELEGAPECVSLLPMAQTDARPPVKHYSVGRYSFNIDDALTLALKGLCKEQAVTPFMMMASAMSALTYRLTGDRDIVVGIPDGDRGHSSFDSMIGFTVNMLAIRSKVEPGMRFSEFLENYRATCLGAYEHRLIPFDFLLQSLNIPRRTSHSPVFQISVNYQIQGAYPDCEFGEAKATKYDHHNARLQTDIGLEIEETKEGDLHCVLDFDDALYTEAGVQRLSELYRELLADIVKTGASEYIDELNMVSSDDQSRIEKALQPHEYPSDDIKRLSGDLFSQRWSAAVNSFPEKAALIDEQQTLTYSEMNAQVNRISNYLVSKGVSLGDHVVVCSEQNSQMVLAMYGSVKAGAAYVPVDPDFPEERIRSMVEDTKPKHVLVDSLNSSLTQKLVAAGFDLDDISVVQDLALGETSSAEPSLSRPIQSDDAFCCIFTSGSTGRPKGIGILHGSLRYQMEGYNAFLGTSSSDTLLLSSAMVFDLSLTSIYGGILFGATTVVASREARYSPQRMIDLLVDSRISSCIFTPTQFKLLFSAPNSDKLKQWRSLRSVVLAGEQIAPWIIESFHALGLENASISNGYAPAETTVVNALVRLQKEDATKRDIMVGPPLWPSRFAILDSETLKPVPTGMPGELFIGGPTVNKGYLERDEATKKAFLEDPMAADIEKSQGHGRVYRTGDRFRMDADGSLHSCGRIGGDRQVKIRGMRTELGEIENAIWAVAQDMAEFGGVSVGLTAVVYHTKSDGDGVLAAYLTTTDGPVPSNEDQIASEDFIKSSLKTVLPMHMMPAIITFIESMPKTASGKTDYKALREQDTYMQTAMQSRQTPRSDVELDPMQKMIADVWAATLEREANFDVNDNFFARGGHSLILMHVQSKIEKTCGAQIALADIFANPTISGMADLVRQALDKGNVNADAAKKAASSTNVVNWRREGSLKVDWYSDAMKIAKPEAIIMTGASGLAGSHFLYETLTSTDAFIHAIATPGSTSLEARRNIGSALVRWGLLDGDVEKMLESRVKAYPGSLEKPKLGLSATDIASLDTNTQAIYHLDSDVSLLQTYESVRAANLESTRFLIELAHGSCNNTKAMHYLSTWGVPHLQIWHGTERESEDCDVVCAEVPSSHCVPSGDSRLGYLKCRWACESLLEEAAQRGVPTTIFRSSMFAPSAETGMALNRTDINRRILAASIATGKVPDFASCRGGGMSWITADWMCKAMLHFAHREIRSTGRPSVYHLIGETHIRYCQLAKALQPHVNKELKTVKATEWFAALRESKNAEMSMQAEALEQMYNAGWVPFQVDGKETVERLKKAGIELTKMDGEKLMSMVVGTEGF